MDAPTESASGTGTVPARSVTAPDDLRIVLSNLSHELCRPLTSLRAGFDLLMGNPARPIAPEQRSHLEMMVHLCDDLLRLTRSYLDYAVLVHGVRPMCFGAFTMSALVREIDREFAPAAAARRLSWDCLVEGPDATVTTDASRCQQIFGNLVANALKYTPEGGQVRVLGQHTDSHWLVTVSDNGPGIPQNAQAKVFDPLFRLTRCDHTRQEGSGLGLAACRQMVEQMAGEITIQSSVGHGTRVSVRFPINAPGSREPQA